jgi:excisionase family DNA binding protein
VEQEPLAITIPDAAKRLSVSERTIRRLIERGELRAVRVGRVWRVPMEALRDYLSGSQVHQSQDSPRA